MKVFLVGSTSALATVLVPALSEIATVITAGRRDSDVRLDLTDAGDAMLVPEGVDALILVSAHFGGSTDAEILEAEAVNVMGTLKLCQAADKANTKQIVLISSMSASLTEDSPYFGAYALSKRHQEEVARLYCRLRALPLAILRPSQIYGSQGEFKRHQPFVYVMADCAERGQDITIFGTRDARRNYIHAADFATVIARVVQQRVDGTYSCLCPSDVTYTQIASAAFQAFGTAGKIRFREDQPDVPDNVFPPDDRLYRKLGFVPEISIEEGMRRLADFRRQR